MRRYPRPGASFLLRVRLTRQVDRILVAIPAGVARPHMPDAIIRQMLGPFRGNDIRTALRTLIDRYSSHGRFLLSLLLRRICVEGKGSIAWQRRNRANIVVYA